MTAPGGIVELIAELAYDLCRTPMTAAQAAALIGAVESADGGVMPLSVAPSDGRLGKVEVAGAPEGERLANVTLRPGPGAVTLEQLAVRFGEGREMTKVHYNSPTQVMFELDDPGLPLRCALIARLHGDAVASVILRIDERL